MNIEFDDAAYAAKVQAIVDVIDNDPTEACRKYGVVYQVVDELLPDHPENYKVFAAIKRSPKGLLTFTVTELKKALEKQMTKLRKMQKEADVYAAKQARLTDIQTFFGAVPKTEREFVALAMHRLGYDMTYDRKFVRRGVVLTQGAVVNDLHLTAGDLCMVKPHGDLLSTSLIDRAIDEWCSNRKEERRQIVRDRLEQPMTQKEIDAVNIAFQQYCTFFLKEPDFGEACYRKAIWQIKRKLFDLPVKQVHFFVMIGAQNAGKTWTSRAMFAAIEELVAECSLQDALDDRQMDLPTMYALFIDELARLDRVDSASLKTFITGEGASRRPMRTNSAEKVKYNATLFATSNTSLDLLIYDNSGMRRYVEIHTKTREDTDMDNRWFNYIEPFDWLSLWRSVDMYAEDPLISKFENRLTQKQEAIRSMSNTEAWAREFYYEIEPPTKWSKEYGNGERYPVNQGEGTQHIPETSNRFRVEFKHNLLNTLFRQWEDTYDPGFKTGILKWGKEMKSLIETGQLPEWSRIERGHNVVLVWTPTQGEPQQGLVPIKDAKLHDIKEMMKKRQQY